jgi:hypothetical protein
MYIHPGREGIRTLSRLLLTRVRHFLQGGDDGDLKRDEAADNSGSSSPNKTSDALPAPEDVQVGSS